MSIGLEVLTLIAVFILLLLVGIILGAFGMAAYFIVKLLRAMNF